MAGPHLRSCGLVVMVTWLAALCAGQERKAVILTGDDQVVASGDLPDAPSPMSNKTDFGSIFGVTPRTETGGPARKLHLVIQPGEFGVPLSRAEKLELSIRSRFTLSDAASTLFSAGWSQVRDSKPHFGTDSGAFGERLGALALKQTTQSIFSYGIYAGAFHDDPRYYVMGRESHFAARAFYSASRLVIARKDDGTAAVNWPKLAGIASSNALTNLYYPKIDHGFANTAAGIGVSLGTSIINNEIHEFIGDCFRALRHDQD